MGNEDFVLEDQTQVESDDGRVSREDSSRETEVSVEDWVPASPIPDPKADPDNDYRWVRVETYGEADFKNVSTAMRDQWRPVSTEDPAVKDMHVFADLNSKFPGKVQMGGLLLCRRPKPFGEKARLLNEQEIKNQMNAVESQLDSSIDPSMPLKLKVMKSRIGRFGEG